MKIDKEMFMIRLLIITSVIIGISSYAPQKPEIDSSYFPESVYRCHIGIINIDCKKYEQGKLPVAGILMLMGITLYIKRIAVKIRTEMILRENQKEFEDKFK